MIENLTLIVVGWLLGLLGPTIVDAIRQRRQNERGRIAILGELRELACTLALAAHGVRASLGTLDRDFLAWLKKDLESHATGSDVRSVIPKLNVLLQQPDHSLAEALFAAKAGDGIGVVLQKYSTAMLDSRVSALWSFDTQLQRQLLNLKRELTLLDDLVDQSRKYADLTFSLDGADRVAVANNFNIAIEQYARRCERIVRTIRQLHS